MTYEELHKKTEKLVREQWLKTPHGKMWQALTDYMLEDEDHQRYCDVMDWLDANFLDYSASVFEETLAELIDAEEEQRDPYGYRGVSRSDF